LAERRSTAQTLFRQILLKVPQHVDQRLGAVDDEVGCGAELQRSLRGGDRDSHGTIKAVKAAKRIEIGGVVAGVERATQPTLVEQCPHRGALVCLHRRSDLEHLAAEAGVEAECECAGLYLPELGLGVGLVRRLPVVEDHRETLVLDRPLDARGELVQWAAPTFCLGRQLEPVDADVDRAFQPDDAGGIGARPSADAGDERVLVHEPSQLRPRLLRYRRELGTRDDRRQGAVDVEQDCGFRGRFCERREQAGGVHGRTIRRRMTQPSNRSGPQGAVGSDAPWPLLAVGLAAGAFSALFGVGGGVIVVPILVLAFGFGPRLATGTSLAALVFTAAAGTVAYALHGDVKPGAAAIVGIPAVFGVVAGVAVQQRLATRSLTLAFAVLLAAVGIRLLV
jgi:hypothetical protein